MFDVHCHMLPGIDDGSKNVDMSLEMINRSVEQGVEGIIFTPHFYYKTYNIYYINYNSICI